MEMNCNLLENRTKNLATLYHFWAKPWQIHSSCLRNYGPIEPELLPHFTDGDTGSANEWNDWVSNPSSRISRQGPVLHLTDPSEPPHHNQNFPLKQAQPNS